MTSPPFAPLADLLATDHTVVTYDPRGLGQSTVDDPSQPVTPDDEGDDLASIHPARARDDQDRPTHPRIGPVRLRFDGDVIEWRGPAPFFFVAVPEPESAEIAALAPMITYGWGVIPVTVTLGATIWTTSLFPKDGGYLVPLKAVVRKAEGVDEGDTVAVGLQLGE